jgi:hypothetical protein
VVCQPGGKRPGCGFVSADRHAVIVDAFEQNLVLAHVQFPADPAPDRLHTDLGGSPQVMNGRVPRLANCLPVFVEERLRVRADPHRAKR